MVAEKIRITNILYSENMKRVSFLFIIAVSLVSSHLLPEDSVTDEAEQLNREKRDNFLDSILKSIPFFNSRPTESTQDEDDLMPDAADFVEIDSDKLVSPSKSLPTTFYSSINTVRDTSIQSDITISHIHIAPTSALFYSTTGIISLTSSQASKLTSVVNIDTPIVPSPYASESHFTLYSINSTVLPTKTIQITNTIKPTVVLSTTSEVTTSTVVYASSSSAVKVMPVSSGIISPSKVEPIALSSSAEIMMEPVIKMMIMSAENPLVEYGPKLPNESGYGDTLAKFTPNEEASEIKNIRFLYSNVLLPVISGIFGALLITVGILVFKCLKRRKLKKVKYYGGKPNSALYRLDQMSLLSDSSSDEE